MAKLTLSDLTTLSNETSAINTVNANSDAIETAIENTLSRDGTSPNEMEADLDMNSNRLLNLPEPTSSTEPFRKGDVASTLFIATSTTSQTITNTGSMVFTIESGKAFDVGTYLVIADTAAPSTNSMIGIVTDYTDTSLTVDLQRQEGSGTFSDWTITISGKSGFEGVDGTDGNTILYGAVDPTTEGVDGDFYINTSSNNIFGPKAAGTWPAGTSLIGPAGADGDIVATGTPVDNQVGVWTSATGLEGTTGLTYDGIALAVTGNITVTGTVDGRDIAADGAVVDANTQDVTLAGTPDYITLAGQVLTRNQIDLTTDVTGLLPLTNLATIDDSNVTAAASATNYTPTGSTVEGHLAGIDTALAGAGGGTATTFQVFTTVGAGNTWNKPTGLVRARVIVIGGGGGGGGATGGASNYSVGAGGGAGGVSVKIIDAGTLGSSETVTIGAAGVGVSASDGTAGTSSSFGAHASATGGAGGITIPSQAIANRITSGSAPGVGSSGDINYSGAAGTVGITSDSGTALGGGGGSGPYGGGGAPIRGVSISSSAGSAAVGKGAGGGGAYVRTEATSRAGGDGTAGLVIVEEYYD